MKTICKRLTAACSAAAMALTMFRGIPIGSFLPDTSALAADDAVRTQCEFYPGSNVNAQNYIRWAAPIESYLTAAADGSLMRFQNGALDDMYLIEYYDAKYNIQRTVTLDMELPLFGGFYETEDHYYLLTGQTNMQESKDVESYRITQYDKDWNRLDSAGLYDCNTTIPFDAGSARFAVSGNYLLIRTCHEMYTYTDGLNHQANVTIQLDMDTMEITDSFTKISNNGNGYVSHSFNQFIHTENDRIVAVDHGDAGPRSIVLIKYNTDLTTGAFTPDYNSRCDVIDVVAFPDSDTLHYNNTGAAIGGFEISDTSYLIAYAAESYEDNNVDEGTRNISVGVVDKATDKVTNIRITDYEEGSASASAPHLVKLADDSFVLLWSREDNVYYTALDGEGDPDEIHTITDAALSDCVPIVSDGQLVWYTWDDEVISFYDIALSDLSQNSVTVIENGHDMEVVSEAVGPGENCTMECTKCGESVEFATPEYARLYWNTQSSGTYSGSFTDPVYTNDSLYYWMYDEYFTAPFHEYIITCSDPEAVLIEPSSYSKGKITFLKEGEYKITATHKYNPSIMHYANFYVQHDKTHTLVKKPAPYGSNIASAECQDCDYTEEFEAPIDTYVVWHVRDNVYSTSLRNPYCPGTQTLVKVDATSGSYDNDVTFVIEDPEIAQFTEDPDGMYDLEGMLSILKAGTTKITIYPTYNPNVKKTYTLVAGHTFEDGVCTVCGTECAHDSGNITSANCQSPAICEDCGLEFGEPDADAHVSDELTYAPNENDPNSHDVHYGCCNMLYDTQPHEFVLDEETGEYLCICGEEAAVSVSADDEVMYFSDILTAFDEASVHLTAVVTLLDDICIDPFATNAGNITLDLNGMNLTFSDVNENGTPVTVYEQSILTVRDSAGGGCITAPEGANLFAVTGGILQLESGSFRTDETAVVLTKGDLNLSGGSFTGKYGIAADGGEITFLGAPEFDCSETDIVLAEDMMLVVNADLGESCYSLQKTNAGIFAIPAPGASLDAGWFEIMTENRLIGTNKSGELLLQYDLTAAEVAMEPSESPYHGSVNTPEISAMFEGMAAEFIVTYLDAKGEPIDAPINAGAYTAVIAGTGDYTGTLELAYHITDAVPELAWTAAEDEMLYNGLPAVVPAVEITLLGTDVFEGEIRYSYREAGSSDEFMEGLPVNAGSYEVMAEVDAFLNYTSAQTAQTLHLTIEKAPAPVFEPVMTAYSFTDSGMKTIEVSALPDDAGKLGVPEVRTADSSSLLDLTEDAAYKNDTVSFVLNKNRPEQVGETAEITVTISSQNYEDMLLTVEITIDKGELTAQDLVFETESFIYDGTAKTAVFSPAEGVTGIGELTLTYYNAEGEEVIPTDAGTYTVTVDAAEGKYYYAAQLVSADWTFTITPAAIAEVSPDLTAPQAGKAPAKTFKDGESWTASMLTWDCETENFDFNTAYTATLTLTADSNYYFADLVDAEGCTILTNDGTVLVLEKTFEPTAKAKITSMEVPEGMQLDAHYTAAEEIIALLPASIAVTAQDGTETLALTWEAADEFDPTPAAKNAFTWTAKIGELDADKFPTQDVIYIVNADYTDVSELLALTINDIVYGSAPSPESAYCELDELDLTYSSDGMSFTALSALLDENGMLPVGAYTVQASYQDIFSMGSDTAEFSVSPLEIIITPTAGQQKNYSDAEPVLTFSSTALIRNDQITGELTREPGEETGTYAYLISGLDAGENYTLVLDPKSDQFTIAPAIPVIAEPSAAPISYGMRLLDAELSEGWTWTDGSVIPTVKNDGFEAVMTLTADENYDYSAIEGYDAKSHSIRRMVLVTVIPAPADVTNPEAKSIIYGQKLLDAELSEGWTWADGNVVPTVKNDGFEAIFKIEDDVNYDYSQAEGYDEKTHTITRIIPVFVNKANPLITPLLIGVDFTEGDALPEITLSDGDTPGMIGWNSPQKLLDSGYNLLDWTFRPDDAANYHEISGTMEVFAQATTTATTETTTTTTTTTATSTTTTTATRPDTTTTTEKTTTTTETTTTATSTAATTTTMRITTPPATSAQTTDTSREITTAATTTTTVRMTTTTEESTTTTRKTTTTEESTTTTRMTSTTGETTTTTWMTSTTEESTTTTWMTRETTTSAQTTAATTTETTDAFTTTVLDTTTATSETTTVHTETTESTMTSTSAYTTVTTPTTTVTVKDTTTTEEFTTTTQTTAATEEFTTTTQTTAATEEFTTTTQTTAATEEFTTTTQTTAATEEFTTTTQTTAATEESTTTTQTTATTEEFTTTTQTTTATEEFTTTTQTTAATEEFTTTPQTTAATEESTTTTQTTTATEEFTTTTQTTVTTEESTTTTQTTTTTEESTTTTQTTTTTEESTTTIQTTTTTEESTTTTQTTTTTEESTTTTQTTTTTEESTTTTQTTATTEESTTTQTTATTEESTTTQTTTTTEESTTTTQTTTTTEESTTTTDTTAQRTVIGYTYTVQTLDPQFYFSHNTEEFKLEDLIESVTRYAIYDNGETDTVGELLTDLSNIAFTVSSPSTLWETGKALHGLEIQITDEFGTQTTEEAVPVYIGVKGDANLNGTVDAKDAAAVLIYAAAEGAGRPAHLVSDSDPELESLSHMITNVDGTEKTDAKDAALLLQYAAILGSGEDADWDELLAG